MAAFAFIVAPLTVAVLVKFVVPEKVAVPPVAENAAIFEVPAVFKAPPEKVVAARVLVPPDKVIVPRDSVVAPPIVSEVAFVTSKVFPT